MIDKISSNSSNGTYDYPNQNGSRKHPAVQAYENTPGTKEASQKRTSSTHRIENSARAADRKEHGVVLDLSAKGREQAAEPKKGVSWLAGLRGFFASVFLRLKNFWESDTSAAAETAGQESEPAEEEDLGELPPLDEVDDMPDYMPAAEEIVPDYMPVAEETVKSGSLRQLEQVLTADGTKRLAHNSDLLTYYDRRGRIVEIDDTEKHRVLYGDKNVLKL